MRRIPVPRLSLAAAAAPSLLAAILAGCASTPQPTPVAPQAPAQHGPADCAPAQLVGQLEAQRTRLFAAMETGDRKVLDELLTDRFVFVHASGASESRQAFIDHAARNAQGAGAHAGHAIEFLEDDVRLHPGGGADATVTWTSRSVTHPKGEAALVFRATDVLVEQGGRWRWVSIHSTKVEGEKAGPLAGPPQGCAMKPPASASHG